MSFEEIQLQVEKLSPKPGELLVFRHSPSSGESHVAAINMLRGLMAKLPGVAAVSIPDSAHIRPMNLEDFEEMMRRWSFLAKLVEAMRKGDDGGVRTATAMRLLAEARDLLAEAGVELACDS